MRWRAIVNKWMDGLMMTHVFKGREREKVDVRVEKGCKGENCEQSLLTLPGWRSRGPEVCGAQEAAILAKVELVAGVEGDAAGQAAEAGHVVDVVVCAPHYLARGDDLPTSGTTGPE